METWLYRIKIRQKLRSLRRKYTRPIKPATQEGFFAEHWQGAAPDGDYFGRRSSPRFFFSPSDRTNYTSVLRDCFENSCRQTLSRADRAVNHRFQLLGSDDTYLGEQIDWHLDFKSGHRWRPDYFTRVPIVDWSNDSDIKVPWELSRLQHFTDLGRAYWLEGKTAYRDEFVNTLTDWEAQNPIGYGVNWACPMDVAIRAVNIIWGLYFFAADDGLNDNFTRRIVRLLYYHGLHIEKNLEYISAGSNTNHLLSDYLGLLYLGMVFPEFDRSQTWLDMARYGIEKEIRREVFDDGVDYECSTSYHRLVLEIFLSAFILDSKNDNSFSRGFRERLGKMIDFSLAITPPSGRAPLVGDNDDGFIVKLSNDDPAVHSRLIEVGLLSLDRPVPDSIESSEDRLWYLGPKACRVEPQSVEPVSAVFRTGGHAVIRDRDFHLMFNAGAVSRRNLAGHKHNDNLSFTLEIDGTPYLVDPGTYCYTADPKLRNHCRSTRVHNTVMIDNDEQSRYYTRKLFHMFNDARATIDLWMNSGRLVVVSGVHRGYTRLSGRIVHRRTIWAFLEARSISILDQFDGDPTYDHTFVTSFMTPIRDVRLVDNTTVNIRNTETEVLNIGFAGDAAGELAVQSAAWYPRYGVKAPAQLITCVHKSRLPYRNVILISEGSRTAAWWDTLLKNSDELTAEAWLSPESSQKERNRII